MRVLITALGSRGDVQPMLALALALRARGHDAVVNAPPDFEGWSREIGVPFIPSGRSAQELITAHAADVGANPARMLRLIKAIFATEVPVWFESTIAAARGCDLIVTAAQFAAHSVAEKLGIPCVVVVYSPTVLRSTYHPPIAGRMQQMPRWVNALRWKLSDAVLHRLLAAPLDAARAKLALPRLASVPKHLFEERPVMLACDPVVAPTPPDWSRLKVSTTGPLFYDDPTPLDAEVTTFLDAGSPPVYVGFGSMVTDDAARLTRAILEGAGAGGRRVLLSKGWAGIGGGNLPASVKVVHGPMPHAKLFPRVAAVVHHGGAGTTAAALRAGVCQVIVPHLLDQYYYAHRLRKLGIAPAAIPVRKLTARNLDRAIDAAQALPPDARLQAAERLREGSGIARAVEMLESTLAS